MSLPESQIPHFDDWVRNQKRPRTQNLSDQITAAESEVNDNRTRMESVGRQLDAARTPDGVPSFDEWSKSLQAPTKPQGDIVSALQKLTGQVNRATQKIKPQPSPSLLPQRQGVPSLTNVLNEARANPDPRAQRNINIRDQVIEERQPTTMSGKIARNVSRVTDNLNPFEAGYNLLRPEEDIVGEETNKRIEAANRASDPEMIAERQARGQMSAPRRVVDDVITRAGADSAKLLGGVSSLAGIAPNRLSEYLNRRGQVWEEGTLNTPLDTQGNEVNRGFWEKLGSAAGDLGLGVGEIVAMKKASGLSLAKIMAIETALKTSDQPIRERAAAVAQATAMGRILDGHLSKGASAALFGAPTAVQSGTAYLQGKESGTDALLNTAVQAGAGAILGGSKTVPESARTLDLQVEALRNGTRDAVLITKGEQRPDLPPRMSALKTREGVFYFDPQKVSSKTIQAKVRDGSFGEILGNVSPKPETGEPTTVVTAKQDGTEAQTSAVPPERANEQAEVLQAQYPNAQIETGPPEKAIEVLAERAEVNPSARPTEAQRQGVSAEQSAQSASNIPEMVRPETVEPPHHSELQNRRARNTEHGNKGQFKAGKLEPTPEPNPVGILPSSSPENSVAADSQAAAPPPVPEGHTRFYRADNADAEGPQGKGWVARDPEYVSQKYGKGQMGSESVWYRDVPNSEIDAEYGDHHSVSILDTDALNQMKGTEPKLFRRVPESKSSQVSQEQTVLPGEESTAPLNRVPAAPADTTAANKASMSADRAELDLPELPKAERKGWQTSLDNAKQKGLDKKASLLADEVLNKPRSLNDEETAGLVLRTQELKNDHARVMQEIGDAEDSATIQAKVAERDAIENEIDKLTRATKASGTEKGRSLASQKLTINQDYDLVSLVQRAKAAKGRDLTPEERTRYEGMAKQIEDLTSKLSDAEEKVKSAQLQKQIDRVVRRGKRADTRQALDDEFADLRAAFAKAKIETRSGVQASGLAGLDPEGVLTKLVAKMARNRVRAGVVEAENVVDQVYEAIKEHVEGITKRDVRDAISGYGLEPKGDQRSPEAKQLADIRSQLKQLSKQEDIEAGKTLSPRDKTRQSQLLKQEQELQRRLNEGDFSPKAQREPPKYTRETFKLQKRIDELKGRFDREQYRATRSVSGKIADTAAGVGNIPKTMLSMADLSATLRQGGVGYFQHPILSTKAAGDMLKSFTDHGFKNVESAIKSDPEFDLAKKSGVEFTGVDKDDPHLSKREEGYLGSDVIDTLAKGKLNPLRVVKGVKDFSERTFVSFLDSQRLRIFKQQSQALKDMGLTGRELDSALKSQGKYINTITGRGSLGEKGNQAAPLLNTLMFSPRLVASRFQLLNKMLNPVAWANMPKGARQLQLIDNAKFLAGTAAVLGLAKASGASVGTDPDDADFLKIKVGNTHYDTLAGLQQPMRFMIRMAKAAKGGETYAGDTKSDIVADFARSKSAPAAGYAWDYLEGKNRLSGKQFEAGKDALKIAVPLPLQDFYDAIKTDGALKGTIAAIPGLLGVGVQTYKGSPEKPTTQAEKLARRMIIRKMPDSARTQDEIDKAQHLSDLRARSRHGEDVTRDLDLMDVSSRQRNAILEAKGSTRLQEDVNRLGIEDALIVYSVSSAQERQAIKSIVDKKAYTLMEKLPDGDKKAALERRIKLLGITPTVPEKKKRTVNDFKTMFERKSSNQFASQF